MLPVCVRSDSVAITPAARLLNSFANDPKAAMQGMFSSHNLKRKFHICHDKMWLMCSML
jgi:hypothetical protein